MQVHRTSPKAIFTSSVANIFLNSHNQKISNCLKTKKIQFCHIVNSTKNCDIREHNYINKRKKYSFQKALSGQNPNTTRP